MRSLTARRSPHHHNNKQSDVSCASGSQLPCPGCAQNPPSIVSWLGKPDLAIVEKLQEGLLFKYMNKGIKKYRMKTKTTKI